MKCKNCEINDTIKYSKYTNGNFCSLKCARIFSSKEKRSFINEKVSKTLKDKALEKEKKYSCDKCSKIFISLKYLRPERNKHCDNCKRKAVHVKNLNDIDSILICSTRTVAKILKRGEIKCVMCGWDKTTLDIHHILPKKEGGTDDNSNLIPLCPNCHRMAHEKLYDKEDLIKFNLKEIFSNWKEYYNK